MTTAMKKRPKLSDVPMATTCAGELVVNVTHLNGTADLIAIVEKLVPPGQQLFMGLVLPADLKEKLIEEVDDAVADVVGRIGTMISGRASSPSSAGPASSSRGRPEPRPARPRGRRREP